MAAGFEATILSCVSWLGVTYYLTRQEILATLAALTQVLPAGSALVFDYLDREAFDPQKAASERRVLLERVRKVGEPMYAGLDPASLAEDLASLGLGLLEDLAAPEIEQRFLAQRGDGYHVSRHVHLARVVVLAKSTLPSYSVS